MFSLGWGNFEFEQFSFILIFKFTKYQNLSQEYILTGTIICNTDLYTLILEGL